MFETLYVSLGLLFGALGIWITVVNSLKIKLQNEREKTVELTKQNAVLQERIEGIDAKNREKFQLLEQNKEQMRLEFEALASKILENNSQKFSLQNQESLSRMIQPVQEQFHTLQKQIGDVYIKEAKDRSMLQAEIQSIKEINYQMSKDAQNLTKALKGENKKQGIWGEMILRSVLENSGLREGQEYKTEVTLEHADSANHYRPDVILHLPNERDIIIDAKTSLLAYEQYVSAQSDRDKDLFAKQHVASVKKHIKELSDKEYTHLKGIQTLDFIFMFVPVESALQAALQYDDTLFEHAFKKNIVLVGPTTLMVSLRTVENSWKYERQQKNAQEIAKRSGLLFDKFVGFVESIEKLGKQITTVQKTYDSIFYKLHSGNGSITSQFEKLEKLGAANSKNLPKQFTQKSED